MAFEVPDHFNRSFTTNVELLLQQKSSYLADTVMQMSYQGEAAQVIKQFGTVVFQERTVRHKDTEFTDLIHQQRWIFPTDWSLALPIDKEDEIRLLGDLQSPYAAAMKAAWARNVDQTIINAFFGTAQTGKNGVTGTVFPVAVTNQVAVNAGAAAATGLNVEKLIQARQLLAQQEALVDGEVPTVVVTASQISDLLRQTEPTSGDFAEVKALVAGQINHFMGFNFVRSQLLPVDGSGYRRIPVYVKSGMAMGTWNGLETIIGLRPDKENLTQVFMRGTIGATRVQEPKVIEIKCAES
jgi:hypothetical protein